MSTMLEELYMLSDIMDVSGFYVAADDLGYIIKDAAFSEDAGDIIRKIDQMLSENQNVSPELRQELMSNINSVFGEALKPRTPFIMDTSFMQSENQIIANLRNLFAEMPKREEDPETRRPRQLTNDEINDIDGMARNMEAFRLLENSEDPGDQKNAKHIRDSLGEETVKGIELLLQRRTNELSINEFTLPPVLTSALESYQKLENQATAHRSKLQSQEQEIKQITEELSKQNLRYIHEWTKEQINEKGQGAQEIFKRKEYLEGMQDFYRQRLQETSTEIQKMKARIKVLTNQLQLVAGSSAEVSKQILDTVGEDNIKRLLEIGNSER